jgi:hypothetical protein
LKSTFVTLSHDKIQTGNPKKFKHVIQQGHSKTPVYEVGISKYQNIQGAYKVGLLENTNLWLNCLR